MRRLLLPFFAAVALVLGLGALALAQDATPPTGMEEEQENPCPEGAMGTPDSSPEATEMDMGEATPEVVGEGQLDASPASEAACHVDIEGFAFSPAVIEIDAGTTVTWENYDTAPHTVTADDGTFDSEDLAQGDTFSFTFDQPGEWSYFCEIHPNMTGTVIVN